jgi:SAM-dependent methyltransferase
MTVSEPLDEDRREREQRGGVFGEVAELYDAARPGYAPELVPEVLGYAALDGRPAIEFGAGTGKASSLFATAGVPLLCVEADPRMAAVLRRNTAMFPNVSVEVGRFEDERTERRYGLLLAATCWHWFDPARRVSLAHSRLTPGGTLAVLYNPLGVRDLDLHERLADIDREYELDHTPHHEAAADFADPLPDDWTRTDAWAEDAATITEAFTDLRAVRYRGQRSWSTDGYLDLLASISMFRVLPNDKRRQVMAAIADVLNEHGDGRIDMTLVTELFLARAT